MICRRRWSACVKARISPEGLGIVWIWYSLQLAVAKRDRQALDELQRFSDLTVVQRVAPRQRAASLLGAAQLLTRLGDHDVARALMQGLSCRARARMPAQQGDLGILCSAGRAALALGVSGSVATRSCWSLWLAPHAGLNAVGIAYDYSGSGLTLPRQCCR